jgi:hypothetical protein
MPSHDGIGLNEDQCRPPAAPSPSQQHPKHPVTSAEVRPLDRSLQGSQLVPQGDILENDFLMPVAGPGDRAQEQQDQFEHRLIVSWVAAEINASAGRTGLWRTTGWPEVQRVMLSERVLDVQRYPKITFTSRSISLVERAAERITLRVLGDLTLHGITRPVIVPVGVRLTPDGLSAEGTATLRQTDFGIQPVTAGAGTVKVKDEIQINLTMTLKDARFQQVVTSRN